MLEKNKNSEYGLALNYINGDNESLGELYNRYFASLVMVAYKYTQNTERSKDLVSLVFEKLIQLHPSKRLVIFIHATRGLYPMLVTIIKNKSLDEIKTNKLHQEINKQLISFGNIIGTNAAFNRFEEDAIHQLMDNLPRRESEILQLHLKGYKNEEIAIELQISYNTVRNTLHNGKKNVRELWKILM